MTINEVKATLRAGIEAVEHGRSTFEQAAADAAEAIVRANQLLHDSEDGEVQIDAPEAAGNIVVVALIAGITIRRFSQTISDTIARMSKRGNEDRTQRPDSRDGSP